MTNEQLYIAIGVPAAINAVLLALLLAYTNAKVESLRCEAAQRFDGLSESVNRRLDGVHQRFEDTRDLWRAELSRVEEVIDTRLKHLEGRG